MEYKAETKTFFAEEVCVSSPILQSFAIPQLYFRSVSKVIPWSQRFFVEVAKKTSGNGGTESHYLIDSKL